MRLEVAKGLGIGTYIHTPDRKNADGTPMRAKVTSVKVWVTRPGEVEVRVKRGLKEFHRFREYELHLIEEGYGS